MAVHVCKPVQAVEGQEEGAVDGDLEENQASDAEPRKDYGRAVDAVVVITRV